MEIKYKKYPDKVIKIVKRGNETEYIEMTREEYKESQEINSALAGCAMIPFIIFILWLVNI